MAIPNPPYKVGQRFSVLCWWAGVIGFSGQMAAGPFWVLTLLCGVCVSCNHTSRSLCLGCSAHLWRRHPMGWGTCVSPWKSAGQGSLFSLAWSCPSLWARSPLGSSGAGAVPKRGKGKVVALILPGPPEDKRLLIAMATNNPCVVTALLSPWKRTEYHIATCASRTHGNGPVAFEHPLLDLCSGRWWWGLSRDEPTAAERWSGGKTGEEAPKGCRKPGVL